MNNNTMGDTISNDIVNITVSASSVTSTVFFMIADSVYSSNVTNNVAGSVTVSQPLVSSTNGSAFYGLYFSQGASVSTTTNISDNKFGSFTVTNSIKAVSSSGTGLYGINATFGTAFSGQAFLRRL
jgi:hypothetical protein